MIRTVSAAAITFACLLLSSMGASAGTWCAQYGGTHGGTNCGFYSFSQCEAARSGNGGYCYQNGWAQRRYRR